MRRSVRPFFGPLAGLFCCGLPSWVKHLEPFPRQRHGVEMQVWVRLVRVLHHRAQPLAVLLPKPRHCRLTEPGPVLALLSGQGHHPSRQGEAIGAQLAPLASWLLSAQSWASFAAPAGVQPCSTWGGRGWATWGQASGSRMASAAISRADHLRGWPCCLEPWRAYASMCRNWKPMAAV